MVEQPLLPIVAIGRLLEALAQDGRGHVAQELGFVLEMIVEGRSFDAELAREAARRQTVQPYFGQQLERGARHLVNVVGHRAQS